MAQGYATQGARQQAMNSLANSYINSAANINQQTQQQLGNLQDTASKEAFNSYQAAMNDYIAKGTLTQNDINTLQQRYYGLMNPSDLANAQTFNEAALKDINRQADLSSTLRASTSYEEASDIIKEFKKEDRYTGSVTKNDVNNFLSNPDLLSNGDQITFQYKDKDGNTDTYTITYYNGKFYNKFEGKKGKNPYSNVDMWSNSSLGSGNKTQQGLINYYGNNLLRR